MLDRDKEPHQPTPLKKQGSHWRALLLTLGLGAGGVGVSTIYLGPTVFTSAVKEVKHQGEEATTETLNAVKNFSGEYVRLIPQIVESLSLQDLNLELEGTWTDIQRIMNGDSAETSLIADLSAFDSDLEQILEGNFDDFESIKRVMNRTEEFVKRHPENQALQAQWKITQEKFREACVKYSKLKSLLEALDPDTPHLKRFQAVDEANLAKAIWHGVREKIKTDIQSLRQ